MSEPDSTGLLDSIEFHSLGERQPLVTSARSVVPDELPVFVTVEGTTFLGVYGVVDGVVELTSSDFGEGVSALGAEAALVVAERLLRTMASNEIGQTDTPFMPDHASGVGFGVTPANLHGRS